VQALVLVGGEGTRLRPLTETIPKPALPLAGRPFLAYMIEWLAAHGVDEVVLACGFLPDPLQEALAACESLGEGGWPRLVWVVEPEARGTAGAIKFAERHLRERFLALNGDVLTDLDLSALVRFHERRGARATLGLYPVSDASAYGLVRRDAGGEVAEFVEKPEAGSGEGEGEINAGVYVLERQVLELVPGDRAVSIEREVFPRLVGDGLFGLRLEGYWMDIGTPDRYLQASWDILEGRVRTRVERHPDGVLVSPGAEVAGDAEVGPRAVVSEGCRVSAGAVVAESVLLEGCVVGEESRLTRAILSPGAEVEAGAEVRDAVIARGERVAA
jgi:mannose-1-phosphate guanylyltransferase